MRHPRVPVMGTGGRDGVCLVLGAGTDGIGGAVAARFAAEGYITVVSRRKLAPLRELAERISASGGRVFAHAADARDEDSVAALVRAAEALGPIEVAVYNVGANPGYIALQDTTPKLFRQNWEMSCFGGFLFGQAVAASMEGHGRGGTILFTVRIYAHSQNLPRPQHSFMYHCHG